MWSDGSPVAVLQTVYAGDKRREEKRREKVIRGEKDEKML